MTIARPRSTSTETKRVLCAASPETLVFTLATACEADAIAIPMQNVPVQRPLTHDLLKGCIEQLGGKLTQVVINELADEYGVFVSAIPASAIKLSKAGID